jgi:hypothetical protein
MKLYPSLSDELAQWAQSQPVFFTGSAPTHGAHINVSPKGLSDSHFAVLAPNQCAYIDRSGSGCETISHAYENGRLCLMFMSFGTSPRILRLFCRSSVVEWDQPEFPSLVRQIAKGKRQVFDGARAVILCDIWQVQTSCGYGVPRVRNGVYSPPEDTRDDAMADVLRLAVDQKELAIFEQRPNLDQANRTIADRHKMEQYHQTKNLHSLDGLPGLKTARRGLGESLWAGDAKARLQRIWAEKEAVAAGVFLTVLLYCIWVGLVALLRGN